MPPITVDPDALAGAGESVGSVGDQIATAISTLTSSLAGGARSGVDQAGLAFGHSYQQTAQALLDAGAAAANAGRSIGFGVQMSATNYSRADAASTIGGGASPLSPPGAPAEFSGSTAPSSVGGGVPPPLLWSMIQAFIPDVWPDGSPDQLRATASAWQGFASAMTGIAGQLTGPSGVIAGQQIPEGGAMTSAISELSQSLSGIAGEAGKLATQAGEFADDVENTQNAIRDLLDRVSPSGLWDGIQAIFGGDALEELKAVADDVKTILGEYARQAEGRRDMLQIGMGVIDDAVVAVENWARREFPKYLGDDVGNALATGLDFQLTLGEGVLAGAVDTVNTIGQLDPLRFAYDPEGAKETWAAMGQSLGEGALYATPTGVLANPIGAFNHYKDQVTDAVHADDWSSDRPGYGLGKILFDVGAAVVPGGAAARTTKVAGEAVDAATPSPGRIADLPGRVAGDFAPIASKADDITAKLDDLGKIDDNLQAAATPNPAGPAIPRDLAEPPQAPKVPDAPSGRVPESPTPHASTPAIPHTPDWAPGEGPSAPHASSTTPGSVADTTAADTRSTTAPTQADAPPVDRMSTTPQSPMPTGTPEHSTNASDLQSVPAPSPSSAANSGGFPTPTVESHNPERAVIPQAPDSRPPSQPETSPLDNGASGTSTSSTVSEDADNTESPRSDDGVSNENSDHDALLRDEPYSVDENGHYVPGSLPSYEELRELTKSDPNSAHYWSGRDAAGAGVGPDGSGIAERIAAGSNGTTLEMTLEQNGIDPLPKWDRHDPESVRFWEEASAAYAENASGEVTGTIGRDLRPGNIWQTVEIPRLVENPNVTRIVQIDPDTGQLTTIFERER